MDPSVENNVKAVRRSKEEKKVLRKQIKASHTLLKHEGISTAPQPTKVTVKTFINRKCPLSGGERAGSHVPASTFKMCFLQ